VPEPPPASVRRDGDFVRSCAGQTVSQVGTQVTELALPLVALLQLGASSAAVGVLSLPLLGAIAVGAGALTVLFDVCYLSVLPGLVRREQIQQANGDRAARGAGALRGRGHADHRPAALQRGPARRPDP
jgi:hypothetical protein